MTILTEEEIISLFESLDNDKNGEIDINEFAKGFVTFFPTLTNQTIFSLFRMHDKDGNKSIDVKEFISLIRFMEKKAYNDDPFVILFDKCDVNKNGTLDIEEFQLVWKCFNPDIDLEFIKEMFVDADKDHNGQLDFNEYMDLVANIQRALEE